MTKNCLLFLLLIAPSVIKAQYTEIINSNRPGYSESPYSVGTGIYQIEGGYQYKTTNSFTEDATFNTHIIDQVLRIGAFSERLEFKFLFNNEYHKINSPIISPTSNSGGSYGFGFKYLLLNAKVKNRDQEIRSWKRRTGFHWSMLVPSVGLDASITFGANPTKSEDFTSKTIAEIYKKNSPIGAFLFPNGSFKFRVLLQNHISQNWVFVSNIGFENILFNNTFYLNVFNLAIATTYNINNQWSTFIESKNDFNKYQNSFDIRTGVAFLLNKNLQFDSSLNINTGTNLKNSGVSVGFSWRLDKHVDKFVIVKSKYTKVKNDTTSSPELIEGAEEYSSEDSFMEGPPSGSFFRNVWLDVSIFSRNLFLKEENHLPARIKDGTSNEENSAHQPQKQKRLENETEEYANPTKSGMRKKQKAEEKVIRDNKKEKEKAIKAQEKEDKVYLEAEEKAKKAKEKELNQLQKEEEKVQAELAKNKEKEEKRKQKEEEKAQKEIKKIEDKEIELYEKAVKDGEKEEKKEAKRKKKKEDKERKALEKDKDKDKNS